MRQEVEYEECSSNEDMEVASAMARKFHSQVEFIYYSPSNIVENVPLSLVAGFGSSQGSHTKWKRVPMILVNTIVYAAV